MLENGEKLIEIAESQLGYPYVFGAWGEYCTPGNRKRRERSDHPTIVSKCQVLNKSHSDCNGCKWQGARMFDCRGFTYWCLKEMGIVISGQGATSQYNTESNWMEKGVIANMPNVPCIIFQYNGKVMQHTGIYKGNGQVIDCSVNVRNGTLGKAWTHYAIPIGLYTVDEIAEVRKEMSTSAVETAKEVLKTLPPLELTTVLRKGIKGTDVKQVQAMLLLLGYPLPVYGCDGSYGNETIAAVKQFQAAHGLTVDGLTGRNTYSAILSAYNALDVQEDTPQEETYTVTLTGLSKAQAEGLIKMYNGTMNVE